MTYFGKQLKEIRKKNNISQKNLAQRLGIVQSTVANYEKGLRFPDQKILLEVASIFNVSIDYLLGRVSYNKDWYLTSDSREFVNAFFHNNKDKARELLYSRLTNIEKKLNKTELIKFYLEMFDYPMEYIGNMWNEGKINIAELSRFSTFSKSCMSAIKDLAPYLNFTTNHKTKLMLLPVCGEEHNFGLTIINNYLEMLGYDTYFIEENIPITDIVEFISHNGINILMLSVTMQFNEITALNTISAIRNEYGNNIQIIVGGYFFNINKGRWHDIGADNYAENIIDVENAIFLPSQEKTI